MHLFSFGKLFCDLYNIQLQKKSYFGSNFQFQILWGSYLKFGFQFLTLLHFYIFGFQLSNLLILLHFAFSNCQFFEICILELDLDLISKCMCLDFGSR